MQPQYLTLRTTTVSAWQLTNWHVTPQQYSFALLSTGGSSATIEATLEDPTLTYRSPNPLVSSSPGAPTAFTLLQSTGGATTVTGITSLAIAAYRLNVNTLSSANAPITLVSFQAGVA